eukprot:g42492.t1
MQKLEHRLVIYLHEGHMCFWGEDNAGHFTVFQKNPCRSDGMWFNIDDAKIQPLDPETKSSAAYVVLLKRFEHDDAKLSTSFSLTVPSNSSSLSSSSSPSCSSGAASSSSASASSSSSSPSPSIHPPTSDSIIVCDSWTKDIIVYDSLTACD